MSQQIVQPSTSVPSEILKCSKQVTTVSGNLHEFYKKCELYDVILIAALDDFKIKAHRVVLSASSKYFFTMFSSSLKEANAEEVKLENIDGITLKLLVDFMYSASVEFTSETVENVLRAAHLYQLDNVIPLCCEFMKMHLDATNCLGITFFAEQYECLPLHQQAFALACKNFEKVCTEKEFFNLNEEQLKRFISRKDICVNSKDILLKAVVSWVEHDKANREMLTFNLMSCLCALELPKICCKLSLAEVRTQFRCGNSCCHRSDYIQYYNRDANSMCIKCLK